MGAGGWRGDRRRARCGPLDACCDFDALFRKGAILFDFIRQYVDHYIETYDPPKTIKARMNANEPLTNYTLYYVPSTGAFGFTTGGAPT
jgi:hypothetical protein